MDLSKLMQQAKQMQEKMGQMSEEVAKLRVTGEAGAGMVKVVMSGKQEVLEVHIEPSLLKSDEAVFLQDLLVGAFNHASEEAAKLTRDKMGGMAGGMGLDPSALQSLFRGS